jgi:threonine dehydratase
VTAAGAVSRDPTLAGVEAALTIVRAYMAETPLTRSEILSRAFDADIWLKNECASPIASFKLRGALCDLVRGRDRCVPEGVVASSSGNHGQGVAWCARRLGGVADIFVPEGTNALKRGMIAAFGGRVHEVGTDIDYARAAAIRHAEEGGLYFVNDGISLDVMEGAATLALEVVRGLDDFDDLVIPTGGGNLAAGCAALLAEMRPGARVIAVQPEAAPVIVWSFREGRPLEVPGASVADGLVSRETVPFAFEVFSRYVAEGWLCGERDILAAVHTLVESAHLLAEPSGAAGLAAAWKHRESLRGRRVVLAITGGNCSMPQLLQALATPPLFTLSDVAGA